MARLAVMVRIEAKTGQEAAVAALLAGARPAAGCTGAQAFQLGPSTFGMFATFDDDAGYEAFASGGIIATLLERTPDLLAWPPRLDKATLLGD